MPQSACFTLRRVAEGRSHFARVHVEVASTGSTNTAYHVETVCDPPAGDCLPSWLEAARSGAAVVAKTERLNVRITRVEGTLADTRDDTVWCAAVMATLRGAGLEGTAQVEFKAGRWHAVLPGEKHLGYEGRSAD